MSVKSSAVSIIIGERAPMTVKQKLAERLAGIGVSCAFWDPFQNFRHQPMELIRQAARRPVTALIFLGDVPGAEFLTAKAVLEKEFGNLRLLQADPNHPETVVTEVKALLGRTRRWGEWWKILTRRTETVSR